MAACLVLKNYHCFYTNAYTASEILAKKTQFDSVVNDSSDADGSGSRPTSLNYRCISHNI